MSRHRIWRRLYSEKSQEINSRKSGFCFSAMLQVQGSCKDPVSRVFMLVSLCLLPLRAAADAIILLLCKHCTSDKYTIPEFRLPSLLLHRPVKLQLHHNSPSQLLSTSLLLVPSLETAKTCRVTLCRFTRACVHLGLAYHQPLIYSRVDRCVVRDICLLLSSIFFAYLPTAFRHSRAFSPVNSSSILLLTDPSMKPLCKICLEQKIANLGQTGPFQSLRLVDKGC